MNKPYSPACDNNRVPILAVIQPLLAKSRSVLEVGSGTGQHAVYFAENLPHLVWYTSDVVENHAGIKLWLNEAGLPNTRPPAILDVNQASWPMLNVDAVFSANTVHIMHWQAVEKFFAGTGNILPHGGLLLLYGPFNYNNQFTSDSNARFDMWLKETDPESGIRNFEDLDSLAKRHGMRLKLDHDMPANNRIIIWEKTG